MNKIGRERGWAPATRQQLEASRTLRGADFVGTPDEIVEKMLFQHEIFGHQRCLLQLGVGTIDHAKVMHADRTAGDEGGSRRAAGNCAAHGRACIEDGQSENVLEPSALACDKRQAGAELQGASC